MLKKMVGRECGHESSLLERRVCRIYGGGKDGNNQVEVEEGLYFAGGGESVIDSGGMSCRLGFNVAGKLFLKWRWGE